MTRATALSRFQDAFVAALAPGAAPADPLVAGLAAQPAFAVYRNTVAKGCVDALQANFPAVARLVGEEWFRAAAAGFAAREPPADPSLLAYGDSFPAFLRDFPPAAAMPWLAGVARLDRSWTQSHAAADEPVLDRAAFARIAPDALGNAALRPHAAARWAWFADAPVFTIWSRNREEGEMPPDLPWRGEGALLTRPVDAVRWTAIGAAGCRFLDACARGEPLGEALREALEADADANLVRLVNALLDAGAFTSLHLPE